MTRPVHRVEVAELRDADDGALVVATLRLGRGALQVGGWTLRPGPEGLAVFPPLAVVVHDEGLRSAIREAVVAAWSAREDERHGNPLANETAPASAVRRSG